MGVFHLHQNDSFCAQFHAASEPGCGIFSCRSCRTASVLPEAYREEVQTLTGKIEAMVNEEPVLPDSHLARLMPSLNIEQINLRFAYLLEALQANPDLSQSPFLQSKVLQDLRDRHLNQLEMLARINEDRVLSQRLSDYLALIQQVREGKIPAGSCGFPFAQTLDEPSLQSFQSRAELEDYLYCALLKELKPSLNQAESVV